jgi:hypothetical protein
MSDAKHKVAADLKRFLHPLTRLREDTENARRHTVDQVKRIARSLEKFGQQKPAVMLPDGTVIAGNGLLDAARRLGWTHLAAIEFRELTKARAYAIADNRTGELAGWKDDVLADALRYIRANKVVLEDAGFTQEEFDLVQARTEGAVDPGVIPEEKAPTWTAHVKMVMLVFTKATHEPFVEDVKRLAKLYRTTTVTDTVFEAMRRAAA